MNPPLPADPAPQYTGQQHAGQQHAGQQHAGQQHAGRQHAEQRERTEQVAALLARWELGCVHRLRAAAGRAPLSLNEFLVLAEICARPDGLTGAQVAGIVGIGTGGATGILARLEEQELVYRDPDPHDRRRIVATASDAGHALVRDDVVERGGPELDALLYGIGPDRLRMLLSFLGGVTDRAYRQSRELRELSRRRFVDELPSCSPPGPDRPGAQ